MFSAAMDWPLSREEKKSQLLRLYNDDVQAADTMLCAGNKTLEALRAELEAVRAAAGVHKSARKVPSISAMENPDTPTKAAEDEVDRLRQAVESAAAVLRAILPQDEEDVEAQEVAPSRTARSRVRSEGADRAPSAIAARPALCRTPRSARKPKRKVSFGGQPEEEPTHSPEVTKFDEEEGRTILLQAPPSRTRPTAVEKQAECRETTASVAENGSRMKLHLTWLMFTLILVALCGLCAFRMGSSPPGASNFVGDKNCWKQGFTPEFCCNKAMGKYGNVHCWDADYTYERCCGEAQEL